MGKPAARLGDQTAHGGVIVVGFPTVLIGGQPAARSTDMHTCPMFDGPKPHVGGPITVGSPTVLIGNMPAARMGDVATCVGPPDTIVKGCPTVLIGEAGSGSASGGGAPGMSASGGAQASLTTAITDKNEAIILEEHWVEIEFVDKAGLPVSGLAYTFKNPDKKESEGLLRLDGTVRRDGLSEGECEVVLYVVSEAKWAKDTAEVGEKVKMSATVEGFEAGADAVFQVFKRDMTGPDVVVAQVLAKTQADSVEAEWEFISPYDPEEVSNAEAMDYSAPQFYFEVLVGRSTARSGLLAFQDYIEVTLLDDRGKPLGNEDYILTFGNGEVRKGTLDGNGYAKEEKVPPAHWSIAFPNRADVMLDQ